MPTGPKEFGQAEDAHVILAKLIDSYLIKLVKHEQTANYAGPG